MSNRYASFEFLASFMLTVFISSCAIVRTRQSITRSPLCLCLCFCPSDTDSSSSRRPTWRTRARSTKPRYTCARGSRCPKTSGPYCNNCSTSRLPAASRRFTRPATVQGKKKIYFSGLPFRSVHKYHDARFQSYCCLFLS